MLFDCTQRARETEALSQDLLTKSKRFYKNLACVQTSPISLLHAEKGRLRNAVANRVPVPCCFSRIRGPHSDWLLDTVGIV